MATATARYGLIGSFVLYAFLGIIDPHEEGFDYLFDVGFAMLFALDLDFFLFDLVAGGIRGEAIPRTVMLGEGDAGFQIFQKIDDIGMDAFDVIAEVGCLITEDSRIRLQIGAHGPGFQIGGEIPDAGGELDP